jgi:hypothetical protein
MTNSNYARAREATFSLNRLVLRHARPRRKEKKEHFEKDRQMARSLLDDPNILGFGVGPKIFSGVADPELCLVVFVRRKLPGSRLRHLFKIPEYLSFNTNGLRVLTDVQAWKRPPVAHALSAGASIGDLVGNIGTMTMVVADGSTGAPLLLSCSHVLARCGLGNVRDEVESPGGAVASPIANVVGRLLRFTKIDADSLNNQVDAAVAKPLTGMDLSNNIAEIGVPAGMRDLTLEGESVVNRLNVQRAGIASGLQRGMIRNLHVSTRITYHQLPRDPAVRFTELVQYDALSEEGDSGAAVVDDSEPPQVVGMHIAGLSDGSTSFFTHAGFVFETLGVRFPDAT